MNRTAVYLRKSRADIEAEARGEGETLSKHRKALLKLAKQQNLNIIQIHEEIVSGESLFHRPMMQMLLKEVEEDKYDAVLVMDMDRLGRGNMQEQGLILSTFQEHSTLIITPNKVYDLKDESDELMTEIQALFARQELKMITRRMQRGRVASVEEGNYIGTRPPYGYEIHKDERSRYLVPHPEQADVVRLIYDMYTNGGKGTNKIANELNQMGYRSYTGKRWQASSVINILKNAVYIGRVQWKKKKSVKSKIPGQRRDIITRPQEEWVDVKGKHEPIIDEVTFQRAQDILKRKYHVPYQIENGITNPLAGIIRCGYCGASMILRPYGKQKPHIMCYNHCSNKSSRAEYVETKLLDALRKWLEEYKVEWNGDFEEPTDSLVTMKEKSVVQFEQELQQIQSQNDNLHDLLERGVYNDETFLERSQKLSERMKETHDALDKAKAELDMEQQRIQAKQEVIPQIEYVLASYSRSEDPTEKNRLLKSIIERAEYKKEKHQRNDEFSLILYPKLS